MPSIGATASKLLKAGGVGVVALVLTTTQPPVGPAAARLRPAGDAHRGAALMWSLPMPHEGRSLPATAGLPLAAKGLPSPGRGAHHRTRAHAPPAHPVPIDVTSEGIPAVALRAYRDAQVRAASEAPSCRLTWEMLAGIGRIESDHGLIGAPPRGYTRSGTSLPPLLGPVLNGHGGVAAVPDTDAGRLDGDRRWDRPVGPLQFLPSTWAVYAVDGNGDGRADVNNVFDAALAAAHYLCAGGGDLSHPHQLAAALFSYNHSRTYVAEVLSLIAQYSHARPAALVQAAGLAPVPTRHHHRHHAKPRRGRDQPAEPRRDGGAHRGRHAGGPADEPSSGPSPKGAPPAPPSGGGTRPGGHPSPAPSPGHASARSSLTAPALALRGHRFEVVGESANRGTRPLQDVRIGLEAPQAWRVQALTPVSAPSIDGGAKVVTRWLVRVPADADAGSYALAITTTYSDQAGQHTSRAEAAITVPYPSLLSAFNNVGISDDRDPTSADFHGGLSWSAQALSSVGITPGAKVTHDGAAFTWPNVPVATPDNVVASGQTIAVTGAGSKVAFLGAASSRTYSGPITIWYADGSSSSAKIEMPGWRTAAPDEADALVATAPYLNAPPGSTVDRRGGAKLYYGEVGVDPDKEIEAIGLPDALGLHLFAVAIIPGSGS